MYAFGSKGSPPYVEELLPGRFVVYDGEGEECRAPTDTETFLIDLLVEASKPLSKTRMRDACTICGDTKQHRIETLESENRKMKAELLAHDTAMERMRQLKKEDGDGSTESQCSGNCGGDCPPHQ